MATAIDPICQMDVDTDNPPGGQSEHEGTTYYFCAPGCKVAFDKEPEKYVSEAHDHGDHEGHDHAGHDGHEGHDEPAEVAHADHDDHGHDHGPGGHSHGHHMPERPAETALAAKRPGFFARLFGKK
ncbi:MAG TPA: YHS domain-containing protein [Dehalococcoidia bacterium]|nr:YHS domain-containing protein [Dehalococcoidia bacterium]